MVQHWICDTCRQTINSPQDGWVEWTTIPSTGRTHIVREKRIVHYRTASPYGPDGSCQFDEAYEFANGEGIVAGRSLQEYIGPDGLMKLIADAADPVFQHIDMMEMISRIQVPSYDRTKGHFAKAMAEGVIESKLPKGYYSQEEIQAVLAHYNL